MRETLVLLSFVTAIAAAQPLGWQEFTNMPIPPSGRPVSRGGWLATAEYGGQRFIFACKGNSTFDFYRYGVGTQSWQSMPDVPASMDSEPVGKGARGVYDGERFLYATKGNLTLEFYRFDLASDSWFRLPDVPQGPNHDEVSAGTDLAAVVTRETTYVYLLKGGTNEFYRFNTVDWTWQMLPDAPIGAEPGWDQGSFMVYDEERSIFAHKGEIHELYRFDLDSLNWTEQLAPMPYIGRSGASRELGWGGGGRWLSGCIYALKGDNSLEFWKYAALQDTWVELDTMPSYGSTGKRKKVDEGGHVACVPGAVFALKGNETCEFWRYGLPTGEEEKDEGGGLRAESRTPTIVCGVLRLPQTGDCTSGGGSVSALLLRPALLDASGRKVLDLTPGENDIRHLAPGIYFVKEVGTSRSTKVIVQR